MKKLSVKIGEYQKDGQTKGKYLNIGVTMSNKNGEFHLLDPSISLAGIMVLQNKLALEQGKPQSDRVMVGVWDESNQQQDQWPTQDQQYQQIKNGQQLGKLGQAQQMQQPADNVLMDEDIPFS